MRVLREFPPNPHAVVLHTDTLLTEQVVETWLAGTTVVPDGWIQRALEIDGLRVLSVNAYKFRLQKQKQATWQQVLPAFEAILEDAWGVRAVVDLVEDEARCRAFPWHGADLSRQVFEGKLQASATPVAAALFAITGISEVILDGHRIEVRRGSAFAWRELAPQIEETLGRFC